jgi:dUTP pyrophosphatase
MKIRIKKLHEDAQVPKYQTNGSSGFDLHALEDVTISPGQTKLVRTGLAFDVGPGYELQVRPRSGLTLKTQARIHFGTLDSDYRGDCGIIVTNLIREFELIRVLEIKKGDRIAQGVVCPVMQADIEVVDYLDDTDRGAGAYGSTGK